MPTSQEIVLGRFPEANVERVLRTLQLGQLVPSNNDRWQVWPYRIKSLGEQPLGEGNSESESWDKAADWLASNPPSSN